MIGDLTVTIERRAKLDKSGVRPPPEKSFKVSECFIAPRAEVVSRGEGEIAERGREGIVVGLTLFAPSGTDIRPGDAIVEMVDGARKAVHAGVWEIEGEPGDWRAPSGWAAGMQVALRRAKG